MNVHLWTNNGARGFLISSIVVIGLTFGICGASIAQQQPPSMSPSAKMGSIPAPPAVPSQKAEPAGAPPAQAAPVAAPATTAPTAPQQAAAPAAAPAPAPVVNAPASPASPAGNVPVPPAAAVQTTAPAESAPAQGPAVAETVAPGTDKAESTASCPPEYLPLVQKTSAALLTSNFSFHPVKALDPFVPFLLPEPPPIQLTDDGEDPAAKSDKPLTPLQLMTVAEIERGLKAITWGALGKKAVIEDATGKGFIVGEGTPAGERSGVIAQIDKDKLVIKQQVWDRTAKRHNPQDVIVKLKKKTDEQVERQAEELASEQSN